MTIAWCALLALGALVWLVLRREPAPDPKAIVVPVATPVVVERVERVEAAPTDEPFTVKVTVEPFELGWVPAGYVRDVPDAKTEALAKYVEAWLSTGRYSARPPIEYRRGVVFVESEEDRGDDGPYPRSAQAEGARHCGSQALWMRSALREFLVSTELTCHENVCAYGGMEYAPNGLVVFRENGEDWVLDAWIEWYSATLVEHVVEKNMRDVKAALSRVAKTSCPNEPAGFYF